MEEKDALEKVEPSSERMPHDLERSSSEVDQNIENLPHGWIVIEQNRRKIYLTPPPKRIKIDCKAKLTEYHKNGRFLEVKEEDLVFGMKRKRKIKSFDMASPVGCIVPSFDSMFHSELDKVDLEESSATKPGEVSHVEELDFVDKNTKKLRKEQFDLTDSVRKLTLDPSKPLDHKTLLEEVARKLNDLRMKSNEYELCPNIVKLQSSLLDCKSEEEIAKAVWSSPPIQQRLGSLFTSKMLEQVLSLGFKKDNPLSNFPPDLNKNLY